MLGFIHLLLKSLLRLKKRVNDLNDGILLLRRFFLESLFADHRIGDRGAIDPVKINLKVHKKPEPGATGARVN